ncbi:hypothetical protein [Tunturiibacter gelidiferens]|uniref:hypothetical protein n=1 Tax=Tunturiibacter gelidiferens TaxID=3069689 RepID=UPI003D9AD331
MPADEARRFLEACKVHLIETGWNFSPDTTKVLMLTHNGIAAEQGYRELARAFKYPEGFSKKEDDHIAFFADKLEPASEAYSERRYGDMFALLDTAAPRLTSHSEKLKWSTAMDKLLAIRETGTVGQVIDHILVAGYPRLPDKVLNHERESMAWAAKEGAEEPELVARIRQLRSVSYSEVSALVKFLNGHTPFATKHSVKGAEFENVLVVLGRGWNKYNFDQFLAWANAPDLVPLDKQEIYERNRNLLYVCCSRPTLRLALLFTQELSPTSLTTLNSWFGATNVHDVGAGTFPTLNG